MRTSVFLRHFYFPREQFLSHFVVVYNQWLQIFQRVQREIGVKKLDRGHFVLRYRVPDEPVGGVWLEEEGEEGEGEGGEEVNMLNDSLLQVYRRDDSTRSPHTLTSGVTNSAPSTPEQKVGSDLLSVGSGTGDSPVIISWDDRGVEGSLMMSQGETKDAKETPMAVVGSEGNTTDLSNVMHHVTSGDGHVTSVQQQLDRGGVAGREGAAECECKLKKVTFAPDVVDKQTTSILKVCRYL